MMVAHIILLRPLEKIPGFGRTSGTRARIFSTYSSPISAGVPEAVCRALNSLGSSGANAVSSPAAQACQCCSVSDTQFKVDQGRHYAPSENYPSQYRLEAKGANPCSVQWQSALMREG